MGIINNLKTFYLAKLVNHILEAIEDILLSSSSTVREICTKVNILQAITFVADSCDEEQSYIPDDKDDSFLRLCFPCRFVLALMGFLCFFVQSSMRVCISIAIVAMVNWSAVNKKRDTAQEAVQKCEYPGESERSNDEDGPFEWDATTQGHILAAYFYGYAATQMLSIRFANTLRCKYIIFTGTVLASGSTILIPTAAKYDPFPVIIAQIIRGLGGAGLAFSLLWLFLIFENPKQHPFITRAELNKLTPLESQLVPPSRYLVAAQAILTSKTIWAYIAIGISSAWNLYLYSSVLPLFLATVLNYNIEKNGIYTSVPFVCETIIFVVALYSLGRAIRSERLLPAVLFKIWSCI
ncbi:sialin-like, partial [Uloborus diversus]|uniref:sialin-like n=1 Tax=Uloborus diversus TaxID=327109 RepID=UPI00240A9356